MKRRSIATDFWTGDVVHHRCADPEHESPGLVTCVAFTADGGICYTVTWQGRVESRHYACELQSEAPERVFKPKAE